MITIGASVPGATLRYVIIRPSGTPRGTFLVYGGGDGRIVNAAGSAGGLFVTEIVMAGYAAVVVDPASNAPKTARTGGDAQSYQRFIRSAQLAADADLVMASLCGRVPSPYSLIGHSNGTTSAANVAIDSQSRMVGTLVLAAPQTPISSPTIGIMTLPLDRVRVPVLIAQHADDTCNAPPGRTATEVARVAEYVRLFTASPNAVYREFTGGTPATPGSEGCNNEPHLFAGVREKVVAAAIALVEGRPVP